MTMIVVFAISAGQAQWLSPGTVTYPNPITDNVSIGTTSNSGNTLEVGRSTTTGSSIFPGQSAISATHNYTSSTAGSNVTSIFTESETNTSAQVTHLLGIQSFCQTGPSQSGDVDNAFGFFGATYHQGSGTITNFDGINSRLDIEAGSGDITNAHGIKVDFTPKMNSGDVTNFEGIYVAANILPQSGTVTNAYGIHIDPITFGSSKNYSIYGEGGTVLFEGDHGGTPDDVVTGGKGTKMMWIPEKRAFRAGEVSNTNHWSGTSIGLYSWAGGLNTIADKDFSFAHGENCKAQGAGAVAMGRLTQALNTDAVALGYKTSAGATSSFAVNHETAVEGSYGAAFNYKTVSGEEGATAFGNQTQADAKYAVAMGVGTRSSIYAGLVVGRYNTFPTSPINSWGGGTDKVFVVGNGTSGTSLNDAFYVQQNGDAYVDKDLSINQNLDINGNGWITGLPILTSDARFKENVSPVTNAVDLIGQLRGVNYDYIEDDQRNFPEGTQYGFIAQEIKEVLPSAVLKDDEGYYGVNYIAVIPLLVEAIKEQQTELNRMDALEQELNEIKALLANGNIEVLKETKDPVGNSFEEAKLFQNAPNPFSQITTISCALPTEYSQAELRVIDVVRGIPVMDIPLSGNGTISTEVDMSQYSEGSYIYSLIVDGKIIDTKTMIHLD